MTTSPHSRPGIGRFPPAVIIRSDPGPSRPRYRSHYTNVDEPNNEASNPDFVGGRGGTRTARRGRGGGSGEVEAEEGEEEAELSRDKIWKEWNINPTRNVNQPPKFVSSSIQYDELGRSINDGITVDVDFQGGSRDDSGNRNEKGRQRDDGDQMKNWYLNIASSSKGLNSRSISPNIQAKLQEVNMDNTSIIDVDNENERRQVDSSTIQTPTSTSNRTSTSTSTSIPTSYRPATDAIINIEDYDNNETISYPAPAPAPAPSQPLRVHSKDWFIRRALLSSHSHSHSHSQPQSESSPGNSTPKSKSESTSSSISSLLNIKSSNPVKRKYEPQYVLGPDNKGYEILKNQLGWQGGGLGKPVGREDPSSVGQLEPRPSPTSQTVKGQGKGKREEKEKEKGKEKVREMGEIIAIELDENGNQIVDLTLSSDSDSDSDFDFGSDLAFGPKEREEKVKELFHGPGRTAPIATALKLDRKGLGHNSSTTKDKFKITHTHKEIQIAQKKARYASGHGHGKGLELGKKGRMKWKEYDKKDRDERRAIKAALG
ncbi:uncharacterized protein IL334_007219 [Kwoniella shivajii]|uniref:G-patch domain-containing protein n=1 Tax=Kwoniella shivajii TaxID=564305 RepID=A0ABZ1D827_9TREE|nr:hypothetical protein IL334_007219 [Kwoniella shivajii]